MTTELRGKVCIVTGGTSGIGRDTAIFLQRPEPRLQLLAGAKRKGRKPSI